MTEPDGAVVHRTPESSVVLSGVVKTYPAGPGLSITAVNDVSLDIACSQSVAITGRSGSGKSTLLHLIGGMDLPDRGRIDVRGTDITTLSDVQRAAFRRTVGFVFQRFHLLPALTALDNVMAPVLPFRTNFDKAARARDLLAVVGLAHRAQHLPSRLSGGEQQRVAVARAMMNEPQLLLADEPTGNLDTRTGADVMGLLFELCGNRRLTLIIATHDLGIAFRCHQVVQLADGRITGTPLNSPRKTGDSEVSRV